MALGRNPSGVAGDADIGAQRLLADGSLAWGPAGVAVASSADREYIEGTASDDSGGAYIVWIRIPEDAPLGTPGYGDLYAQHVSADGVPLWQTDGAPVCTASKDQEQVAITPDGSGGAFLVWRDHRNDPPGFDESALYAHHLLPQGVDSAWPSNGLGVDTTATGINLLHIVSDEVGGFITVWNRGSTFAQRVSPEGMLYWPPRLRLSSGQYYPRGVVPDGAGGAIVAADHQIPAIALSDLYALRVTSSGGTPWGLNGVAVTTATGNQNNEGIVPDGGGGAILAWHDARSDTGDVYAQNVNADGSLGGTVVAVALSLVSADAGPQGVALEWFSPGASVASAQLERTQDGAQWSVLAALTADGVGRLHYLDREVAPGQRYAYRLGAPVDGALEYTSITWVTVPAAYEFALAAPRPNPAVSDLSLQLTLPAEAAVRVEVVDLAGRVVRRLLDQRLGAGQHTVRWDLRDDSGRGVPDGVYFTRVESFGSTRVRRAVVLR